MRKNKFAVKTFRQIWFKTSSLAGEELIKQTCWNHHWELKYRGRLQAYDSGADVRPDTPATLQPFASLTYGLEHQTGSFPRLQLWSAVGFDPCAPLNSNSLLILELWGQQCHAVLFHTDIFPPLRNVDTVMQAPRVDATRGSLSAFINQYQIKHHKNNLLKMGHLG